jgi:hypothetical protein
VALRRQIDNAQWLQIVGALEVHRSQVTHKTLDVAQRRSAAWPAQPGEPA